MSPADILARRSAEQLEFGDLPEDRSSAHSSGVSWAAVLAGAAVTAALSLIMLSLGAGLGLSSFSFWGNAENAASKLGTAAIIWLITNEVVSSAMGGYLAGRLRTKWQRIHNDEVYFRDTAHGFLVWSVAVIISVSFMAAASTSMAGNLGSANAAADSHSYFVDRLFRSESKQVDSGTRGEANRIISYALSQGDINATDENYLEQLVAAQTGLDQFSAQKRVSSVVADARQALETSRKAMAHGLLWVFIALLIGAFSASIAATVGGRQRDHLTNI